MITQLSTSSQELLKQAQWIWPGHRLFDLYNLFAKFRKDVDLPRAPESAVLAITADQGYRLWINGKYVTRGPARGYQAHWPFDTVEIAPYLVKGRNIFAVEVYNPGHSTFCYHSQNSAGLLCAVAIDGLTVLSDATWRCVRETARKRDTALYSTQLFHQEHIQGSLYDRKWLSSPQPPRGWLGPEASPFGVMPWHSLEERGIPQLREVPRKAVQEVSRAEATTPRRYKGLRNITEGMSAAVQGAPWFLLNKDPSPGLDAIGLPAAGKGRFQAVVLDMGQTVVGPVSLKVANGQANVVVDLFFFEMLDEAGAPVIPYPALCHTSMANRLTLKTGVTACDFFHVLGFRYVAVLIHESTTQVTFDLTVADTGYPYRPIGTFECSDPLVNAIWKACHRTEEVCSLDSYVDTPWREQAQWWGDAHVQFRNTMTMDWDPRLMRRGLLSIVGQRLPNGLTYGNAPTMAHNCVLPDYSLFWLISLHDYYARTLDSSVFDENQDAITQLLGYFETEAPTRDGLLSCDQRYWLFLDWSSLEKKGTPTLFSMWYLHALRCMVRLYQVAGNQPKVHDLEEKARRLEAQIVELTFDPARGLFHDGYAQDGSLLGTHSVHVQTLAIRLGLKPEHHKTMLTQRIVPYLEGSPLEVATPSAYWATFVLSVARTQGLEGLVLDFVRRRWAPMAVHGTTFEVFGPEEKLGSQDESGATTAAWGNFSASHAWSAHPLFHLTEMLGGVTEVPETPARVRYRPWFPQDMQYVAVTVPHPLGAIQSRWNREGETIRVQLVLPQGVEAEVGLPGFEGFVSGTFEHVTPSPSTTKIGS